MKDNHNSRSVALYANKSGKLLVSNIDESSKEDTDDEKYKQKMVESTALIIKHFHKKSDRRFGVDRNFGHKSSQSGARDSGSFKSPEKKYDGRCFNCGSPDHFAKDCKKKKEPVPEESYEVKYKKLIASLKI